MAVVEKEPRSLGEASKLVQCSDAHQSLISGDFKMRQTSEEDGITFGSITTSEGNVRFRGECGTNYWGWEELGRRWKGWREMGNAEMEG